MWSNPFHRIKTRPKVFCSQQRSIFNRYLVCCSIRVYFFVKGTSVLLFGILNVTKTIDWGMHPNSLIFWGKHFVVVGAFEFVVNTCIFIPFKPVCIWIVFVLPNKSNIREKCCSKHLLVACWQLRASIVHCCCSMAFFFRVGWN